MVLSACGGGDVLDTPVPPEGVWMKGDLHLHSDHSSDALDNPMTAIIGQAEDRGMDYFVVTDHDNHVDGQLTTWDDPAYRSDRMVLLYGAEWTTAKGHANFFAPTRYDHGALYALREGEGVAIAQEADRQGAHFSANHPLNGDPWEYGFDIGLDSLEVWNALFRFPGDNRQVLALWDQLLATGRRLPGRGGSDCHHQQGIEPLGLNVGTPTTWVYAASRTPDAVVAALDAGRASVSYAPDAERIALWADVDRDGRYETLMGDNVAVAPGTPVDFRIDIEGFRALGTYTVTVIKNGAVLQRFRLPLSAPLTFTDTPAADGRSYYRVEVEGNTPDAETLPAQLVGFYGRFIGLTNPIYFGFDRP